MGVASPVASSRKYDMVRKYDIVPILRGTTNVVGWRVFGGLPRLFIALLLVSATMMVWCVRPYLCTVAWKMCVNEKGVIHLHSSEIF